MDGGVEYCIQQELDLSLLLPQLSYPHPLVQSLRGIKLGIVKKCSFLFICIVRLRI